METMNQLDVADLLRTYAEKSAKAYNDESIKRIIRELKSELDLRKIKYEEIGCKHDQKLHLKKGRD